MSKIASSSLWSVISMGQGSPVDLVWVTVECPLGSRDMERSAYGRLDQKLGKCGARSCRDGWKANGSLSISPVREIFHILISVGEWLLFSNPGHWYFEIREVKQLTAFRASWPFQGGEGSPLMISTSWHVGIRKFWIQDANFSHIHKISLIKFHCQFRV